MNKKEVTFNVKYEIVLYTPVFGFLNPSLTLWPAHPGRLPTSPRGGMATCNWEPTVAATPFGESLVNCQRHCPKKTADLEFLCLC